MPSRKNSSDNIDNIEDYDRIQCLSGHKDIFPCVSAVGIQQLTLYNTTEADPELLFSQEGTYLFQSGSLQ